MVMIGIGMLLSPLWAYRRSFNTVYVVTDRRAIRFDGGLWITKTSYLPDELGKVYRKERKGGYGDVILERRTWSDSGTDELGFLRIQNPQEIENMVNQLANHE